MCALVVREFIAFYLVVTLAATALAKLRRWKESSLTLSRQTFVSVTLAPVVITAVALSELLLSALLATGVKPVVTGSATAALLAAFGGYRLSIAVRNKSLMCACAGSPEFAVATSPAIAALIFTSFFEVSSAVAWTVLSVRYQERNVDILGISALLIPFVFLIYGTLVRRASLNVRVPGQAGIPDQ